MNSNDFTKTTIEDYTGSWTKTTLENCVSLLTGGTPSKKNDDYWGGDIPWVSPKEMDGTRIHDTEDHVTDLGAEEGSKLVPEGTILIMVRGMGLANHFPVCVTQREMTFNQDVKAVVPDDTVDDDFIKYWLRAQEEKLMKIADEAAHGTKRIQTDPFLSLEIDLPPIEIQTQISDVLLAYDDLIDNNQRRIEILEELAALIYREWFVRYNFSGHKNSEFVDSTIGEIPQGWEIRPFSEVVEIKPRERPDRERVKPYAPMGSVSTDSMIIGPIEERDGNRGAKFRNNDTLFARITPSLENGKTGFVRFLDSDDEVGLGSGELITFRSVDLCPELVYLISRDERFRQNAINSMTGASGRQRVQSECFDDYLLAVPPQKVLDDFQELVGPMFDLVFSLAAQNKKLKQMRDLLLPKLILGEIKLSDIQPN